MSRSHITWRGSLRSCNYSCAYCPFAKRPSSPEELARDSAAFGRFLCWLEETGFCGSVLLAPYGEGLVHPDYQERYARLSRLPGVEMISCQTNLSWEPEPFLARLEELGADLSKLALWATFHPSMADCEAFARKCERLAGHIRLCAGMVGDPDLLPLMGRLGRALPRGVRFWVNAMEGLGRRYTPAEVEAFTALDPLFPLELRRFPPDGNCRGWFVDARGRFSPCNRSGPVGGEFPAALPRDRPCGGRCDCFLAYSNRLDVPELLCLGPFPQLRLGWEPPKALFFDLDGTVARDGRIPPGHRALLVRLAQRYLLYPMTARSRESAVMLLRGEDFLSGGVFSSGAEVVDFPKKQHLLHPLPGELEGAANTCLSGDIPLKQLFRQRPEALPPGCRLVSEGRAAMVAANADKYRGVEAICRWNGWSPPDVLVFGNGAEDLGVLHAYPRSIAPPWAGQAELHAARFHMDFATLAELLLTGTV